jgi:hypothetical protein
MRSLASIPNDVNANKKTDNKEEEQPLTMGAKIKKMWKNYGIITIIITIITITTIITIPTIITIIITIITI